VFEKLSNAFKEDLDRADTEKSLGSFRQKFVFSVQTAKVRKPSKCTLNHFALFLLPKTSQTLSKASYSDEWQRG
jgi:hypothetical protein